MEKTRKIIYLAVMMIMVTCFNTRAEGFYLQAGLSKVFLLQDQGYLGKLRFDPDQERGVYLDWLQIGNYYRQYGVGLELLWRNDRFGETWLLMGYERYDLHSNRNGFSRIGARTEFPLKWGELVLQADWMIDDLIGPFLRYQCELRFPGSRLQTQIGIGNLLGSRDGYAVWFGVAL